MHRRWSVLLFVAFALLPAASVRAQAADPLDALVDHDLQFAGQQLNRTLTEVPVGSYVHKTGPDGRWDNVGASWWTSGFLPGSLWLMYQATGDPSWRTAAAARQAGIESQKTNTSTHDVGFMVFDSFGQGYRLTGDDAYRQVALTAAQSLATRYSSVVHATRSWNNDAGENPADFQVIVDNMMNLELLLWASKNGGDPAYASMAVEHALTTAAQHVRPDGSTYHRVIFDSNTGAVKSKGTVQGYSASSTWSRGQAWGIYGFTMLYRETRDPRMLEVARRLADYFIGHLPADSVPYWDFQAPGIPNEPRDSSAAAIAASALLELSQLDPANGGRYLDSAKAILRSLSSPAYLAEGTASRSILLHGTSHKPAGQYDTGLIYGDYYFLEALLRYKALAAGAPVSPPSGAEPGGPLPAPAPPATGLPTPPAPVLKSLRVRPRVVRHGRFTVSYGVDQPAVTTLTLLRRLRSGRYAVAASRKRQHAAGAQKLRMTRKVAGRTLRPGRYRLKAVARNAAGRAGRARTVAFRIVG
jgi:unsaturated chondroitin disaccharide hydrolase